MLRNRCHAVIAAASLLALAASGAYARVVYVTPEQYRIHQMIKWGFWNLVAILFGGLIVSIIVRLILFGDDDRFMGRAAVTAYAGVALAWAISLFDLLPPPLRLIWQRDGGYLPQFYLLILYAALGVVVFMWIPARIGAMARRSA